MIDRPDLIRQPDEATRPKRRSLTILLLPWVVAGGGLIAMCMMTAWLAEPLFKSLAWFGL